MNNDIITADGKKILQSFTDAELAAFQKGAIYGASHHKEINKRSPEWYAKHEAKKEDGRRNSGAFCEYAKQITGLGAAVENIQKLRTYEEVRDEVLEKLMRGLAQDKDYRRAFIHLLEEMDKH